MTSAALPSAMQPVALSSAYLRFHWRFPRVLAKKEKGSK